MSMRQTSVLLVSSSGGHWVQMSKILPALDGLEWDVATVDLSAVEGLNYRRAFRIQDFNRDTWIASAGGLFSVLRCVLGSRATHVISTGAAPGLVAIAIGKLAGKKTMWIDSVANAEKISLSGRLASPFSDVVLTQWEDVAQRYRFARYEGRLV